MHDIQAYETSHLGPRVLFNVPLPISERYPPQAGLNPNFKQYYQGQPIWLEMARPSAAAVVQLEEAGRTMRDILTDRNNFV